MNYYVTKLRRFCGFIAGFIFYISGILKLLDPVGAGLVMDEYFSFLHLGFLGFSSKILGTAIAFAETILGAALITGVWRRSTGIAVLSMQGFFTFLTLLLVIFNPEMDCGCFGEAIHLTHMQTFLKNLGILALLAGNFIPLKGLGRPKGRKFVSFGIVAASTLAFTVYSWMYIPLVDFTAYATTAHLQAAEKYPANEEDMYEAVFTYEKDGKQKTFDLEHLPDSTWTFVSTQTVLKEDFADTAVPLSIYDDEGNYLDSLAAEGKVMVISVYDPDIRQSRWEDIEAFAAEAEAAGFRTLILAADKGEDSHENTYKSDYKTLITLNRSNGGVTYISDGYIIRKWAGRAAPDKEELLSLQAEPVTETMIGHSSQSSLTFQAFLLYVFAVMLLL
ncbi:MAG: hypothetical protein J5976_01190 [Bacteroidales bacterium]|nr:hypothetical protein [Bacteroidales bacterium]